MRFSDWAVPPYVLPVSKVRYVVSRHVDGGVEWACPYFRLIMPHSIRAHLNLFRAMHNGLVISARSLLDRCHSASVAALLASWTFIAGAIAHADMTIVLCQSQAAHRNFRSMTAGLQCSSRELNKTRLIENTYGTMINF